MNKYIYSTIVLFVFAISSYAQSNMSSKEIQDSINVLSNKNEILGSSIIVNQDSLSSYNAESQKLKNKASELSSFNYDTDKSIFSFYIGGGLAPFRYSPDFGKKKNEFGYTFGLSYSYFFNYNNGIRIDASLNRFGSSLFIDNLETSTLSVDGDTDNDGTPDEFNLLTKYDGLTEKQNALLIGTAIQYSYRRDLTDKWNFIGSIGPKIEFVTKSESYVSEGSYTTRGHYPQYGEETILPVGPGFGTYTPENKEKNQLGVGVSLLTNFDFEYQPNKGFAIYTGPYFEYQLNSKKTSDKSSLVSYEVSSPTNAESAYNTVLNSNAISNYNRYAVGIRVGINFDVGRHKNHKKANKINSYMQSANDLDSYSDLFKNAINGEKSDSLQNANRIAELQRLLAQQLEKERQDSISEALRRAELARLAEEQRIKDSIENAKNVGVIMEIRTKQLTEDDLKVLTLPLVFEFGTAELTAQSEENANKMSEVLGKYPTLKFQVTGHTCDIGSDEANIIIGFRRANAIKSAFEKGGTAGENIKTFSRGKAEPLVPNINEDNRRRNRRVVVVIED